MRRSLSSAAPGLAAVLTVALAPLAAASAQEVGSPEARSLDRSVRTRPAPESREVWPASGWLPTPDPAAAGWSAEGLARARRFADSVGTAAYMVVEGGRVVDTYGDVTRRFRAHSVRKSLLSLLYGIAADRGDVDLDATLAELGIDDYAELTEGERRATLRQLLQSRSGVYLPAAYENEAVDEVRPERGSHEPGTHWFYSNWDFNTSGTIYQLLTGRNLFAAFRDEVARPLDMEDFRLDALEWRYDTRSWHPAYLFRMSSRDLARVGLLYLRGGRWRDRRIVSRAWVDTTTAYRSKVAYPDGSPLPGGGYGWMWWTPRPPAAPESFGSGVFEASGTGQQVLYVLPDHDLVFVHRTDTDLLSSEYRSVSHPTVVAILELVLEAKREAAGAAATGPAGGGGPGRGGEPGSATARPERHADHSQDAAGAPAVSRLPTPSATELPDSVVALPNPKGPYQVGTTTRALRLDEAEELTDDPDDRREVVVQLFYPARRAADKAPAAYLPNLEAMRRGLREHGFPPFRELSDRLSIYERVQTAAWPEEPVLSGEGPLPVLLFSPGGNVSRHWYTGLVQELASQGYVVALMSHAHSGLDVFPGAGFLASHIHWHPGSEVPEEERAARDRRLTERLAADARATLDFLEELQAGEATPAAEASLGFRGALDLEHVGIVGHSRGGGTVTRACATDPRFRACAVLDNIGSDPEIELGLAAPQLAIRAPWSEARAARLGRFLDANRADAFEVVLAGATHMSFTDLPLVDPVAHPPGDLSHAEAHRRVSTLVRAFFDHYLRDRDRAFRAALAGLGEAGEVREF